MCWQGGIYGKNSTIISHSIKMSAFKKFQEFIEFFFDQDKKERRAINCGKLAVGS